MISPVSLNFVSYKPCFKGGNSVINGIGRTECSDNSITQKADQYIKEKAKCDAVAMMLQIRKNALKGQNVQWETGLLKAYADLFQDDLEFQKRICNCLLKYGSDE